MLHAIQHILLQIFFSKAVSSMHPNQEGWKSYGFIWLFPLLHIWGTKSNRSAYLCQNKLCKRTSSMLTPVGSFYWSPITSNKGQIPPAIFQSTPYPILLNVFTQAIPLPYSPPFLLFQILLFLQGYQIAPLPLGFPLSPSHMWPFTSDLSKHLSVSNGIYLN